MANKGIIRNKIMNEMKYDFSIKLLETFLYNKYRKDVNNAYDNYHKSIIFKQYIKIYYTTFICDYDKDAEFFLESINSGIVPQSIIDEIIEFSISNL